MHWKGILCRYWTRTQNLHTYIQVGTHTHTHIYIQIYIVLRNSELITKQNIKHNR